MTEYRIAAQRDIEQLMSIRLEMLLEVNALPETYEYDEQFIRESREYFENGQQITILAQEREIVVGCATLCYLRMMPTFSHPTGKRAHLMNVYVKGQYRRQGIAAKMVEMLIREATARGVTEISLDATPQGRLLYERMGFAASEECMVLPLGK